MAAANATSDWVRQNGERLTGQNAAGAPMSEKVPKSRSSPAVFLSGYFCFTVCEFFFGSGKSGCGAAGRVSGVVAEVAAVWRLFVRNVFSFCVLRKIKNANRSFLIGRRLFFISVGVAALVQARAAEAWLGGKSGCGAAGMVSGVVAEVVAVSRLSRRRLLLLSVGVAAELAA